MKGLMNLGNTCYINTAIQCLTTVPDFVRFMLAHPKRDDAPRIVDVFVDLLINLVHGSADFNDSEPQIKVVADAVSPRAFVNELKQCLSLHVHDPNDIQEFVALFLDKLNAGMCRKLPPEEYFADEFDNGRLPLTMIQKLSRVHWYKLIGHEYSPIKDLFYGLTVSQIRCANCDKLHHNYEVFSTILVPPPNERTELTLCLDNYFKEEKVADDWKCDGCNMNSTDNAKIVRICRLPKTLTVCIKRFADAHQKNNVIVDAPIELDVDSWTLPDGKGTRGRFKLRAMACHSGDQQHGHYWGLMKSPVKQDSDAHWFKIDDAFVFHTGQPSVETPTEAYMFVYVRNEP